MIWALVLAAGASSRMGQPKALLPLPDARRPPEAAGGSGPGEEPAIPTPRFLDAIADAARGGGARGVVAVLGPPHGEAIRAALPAGVAAAWNPQPERGMLSSVQAGLAALPAEVATVLVWPVDIPFVSAETVRAVLAVPAGAIVVPTHDGRGGHPLRLPRRYFGEVMQLDPARGLKALLQAHAAEVVRLPVADRNVLVDVDTPDDYARTRA